MPIVKVSDKEKIRLLKVVNNQMPLKCAFRSWEMCEYPFSPQNTSHSWKVKTYIQQIGKTTICYHRTSD
jgi:hypothetical protein